MNYFERSLVRHTSFFLHTNFDFQGTQLLKRNGERKDNFYITLRIRQKEAKLIRFDIKNFLME